MTVMDVNTCKRTGGKWDAKLKACALSKEKIAKRNEETAGLILNNTLDKIETYMTDIFSGEELSSFSDLFEGTEGYYDIKDEIQAILERDNQLYRK